MAVSSSPAATAFMATVMRDTGRAMPRPMNQASSTVMMVMTAKAMAIWMRASARMVFSLCVALESSALMLVTRSSSCGSRLAKPLDSC